MAAKPVEKMLVRELQAELKELGVNATGRKAELAERLYQARKEAAPKSDDDVLEEVKEKGDSGEHSEEDIEEGDSKMQDLLEEDSAIKDDPPPAKAEPSKKRKAAVEPAESVPKRAKKAATDSNEEKKEAKKNVEKQKRKDDENEEMEEVEEITENPDEENESEKESEMKKDDKDVGEEELEKPAGEKKSMFGVKNQDEDETMEDDGEKVQKVSENTKSVTVSTTSQNSTPYLHLQGFKRPLREEEVKEMLESKGRSPLLRFKMNSVKSECYLEVPDVRAAKALFRAVHRLSWKDSILMAEYISAELMDKLVPKAEITIAKKITVPTRSITIDTSTRKEKEASSSASDDSSLLSHPSASEDVAIPGPPTRALRVRNFQRPFQLKEAKKLMSRHGDPELFAMDNIKTFCYALYTSIEIAEKSAAEVHNLRWPALSTATLSVSYVDPEEAQLFVNRDLQIPLQPTQPTPVKREENVKTLDELFQRTETKPRIYYQPVSAEKVAERKAARAAVVDPAR